jgi:uncharacterized membrane protein (UPF0127 family)
VVDPVTKTKLIVNLTRGECVCVGELADRPLARMRGLIGRQGLPAGEGLLLTPAPSIHTAFMRFPIDALFLDRDLRVLDIRASMPPWRVASKRTARAVLELSAGECARRGVDVGDRLELRDRKPPGDRKAPGVVRSIEPNTADADASESNGASTLQERWGQLARLRPLRVLVISPDRHFLTVMSLLLARRNCSVTTTANANRVIELIDRESSDVVLIDAGKLQAPATLAKVQMLARPVGVVLVADEARPGADQPVLAKWGPFEDLAAAIERADERRGTWGDARARG